MPENLQSLALMITNTSSFAGDDYEITLPGLDPVRLKPGESVRFSGEGSVDVVQRPAPNPLFFSAPRIVKDRQETVRLVPRVKVDFEPL